MTDDGEEVLENIIRDLEKTEDLLARAEVIQEAATNRLKLYRERYHDENHPMPPDETDFIGGNKDVYSGPPAEEDDSDE